jgi:competence protein ComFB
VIKYQKNAKISEEAAMPTSKYKNFMEDCVEEMLPALMDQLGVCTCEQCRTDIIVFALNKLPPQYTASTKGHLFTRIQTLHGRFDVEIIKYITMAAEKIKANPSHA